MDSLSMSIQDGSGDRKYFTIIPNYIYNHSTHWDREVYCQMKRIAGENGKCYKSLASLAKQCGLSEDRIKKSIKYLVEHNWIKKLSPKRVVTTGGDQFVNCYEIVDLWKLNINFYEKGGASDKGACPARGLAKTPKGGREIPQGGASDSYKEEPTNITIKEEPILAKHSFADSSQVNKILNSFKEEINPTISFGNKTQRKACEELIKQFGIEKVVNTLNYYKSIRGEKFSPVITTPCQLRDKMGQLITYYEKNNKAFGDKIINI